MTSVYHPCGCAIGGHEPGVCQIPDDAPAHAFPLYGAELIGALEEQREAESEATWWIEVAT